jgi:hypothetical protein
MDIPPILLFSSVMSLNERGERQRFYQPKSHLPYLPAFWPPESFGASLL